MTWMMDSWRKNLETVGKSFFDGFGADRWCPMVDTSGSNKQARYVAGLNHLTLDRVLFDVPTIIIVHLSLWSIRSVQVLLCLIES